jgi:hypothetical protein
LKQKKQKLKKNWLKTLLNKVKDTFINIFWHSKCSKTIRSKYQLFKQKLITPVIEDDIKTIPYRVFLAWLLDIASYGIIIWIALLPITVNPLWALMTSIARWFILDFKKDWNNN